MTDLVRLATPADIPGIIALVEANPDTLLPRLPEEVAKLLPAFWVAEADGHVVGCCCLEVYSPKIAEIRTLVVAREYRDRGLGSELVKTAVAEAKRHSIREILVVTSNVPFFEQLNFGACLHEKYALFYRG